MKTKIFNAKLITISEEENNNLYEKAKAIFDNINDCTANLLTFTEPSGAKTYQYRRYLRIETTDSKRVIIDKMNTIQAQKLF